MRKTAAGWTVLGEDPPVLVHTYSIGPGNTTNCMAVGIGDGRLAVVSAPTNPSDALLADLEGFGAVAAVVANNGFHRSGLPHWRAALPDVPVFAPTDALPRVRKVEPTARDLAELEVSGPAQLHALPGTRIGDTWVVAPSARGLVWYVSDTITNMPTLPPPPFGWLMWAIGLRAGFRMNGVQSRVMTVDRPTRAEWMQRLLADGAPALVVPAHGAREEAADLGERLRGMLA